MSSPQPAQNRALLSLSAVPTTRPLSLCIMSPLYCLLRSSDDNFKAQILFVGGGGRMAAVWEGPELGAGWVSALCAWRSVVCLGPPPTHNHYRGSRGKLGTPRSLCQDPHPEVTWPRPTPSLPPHPTPRFEGLEAGTSSKEPALVAPFGHCLSLLIQMILRVYP